MNFKVWVILVAIFVSGCATQGVSTRSVSSQTITGSLVNVYNSPVKGDKAAKIAIIEFSDYQ
jgi:hypothetical protein